MKFRIMAAIALVTVLSPAMAQDDRAKTLDFIILLDKSLSMDDKIEGVKDFFRREILGNQLKAGDSLLLIGFYGRQEILADLNIQNPADRQNIQRILQGLRADGAYTDIGGAIDHTVEYVKVHPRKGSRQHFILLTDGIQESPPGSPYQGPKGYISHPFLDNAKTLARSGWKIQILGIGSDTAAEDLARELSGTSSTWKNVETLVNEGNPGFFESIELLLPVEIIEHGGVPTLKILVQAQNLPGPREIQVSGLNFIPTEGGQSIQLSGTEALSIPGNGTHELLISLQADQFRSLAGKSGELAFQFAGKDSFSPGRFPLSLPDTLRETDQGNDPGWTSNHTLVFFLICFIIILVMGIFVWRSRRPSGKEERVVRKKS